LLSNSEALTATKLLEQQKDTDDFSSKQWMLGPILILPLAALLVGCFVEETEK